MMAKVAAVFQSAWGDSQPMRETSQEIPSWVRDMYGEVRPETWPSSRGIYESDPLDGSLTDEELADIILREPVEPGEIVGERVHDVLAYYLPYSFYGSRHWGVYLNELACLRLAASLFRSSKSGLSFGRWTFAVEELVLTHEQGHFATEYLGASLRLGNGSDVYRVGFKQRAYVEEPLCTLHEMAFGIERQVVPNDKSLGLLVLNDWKSLALPSPYDRWPHYLPKGELGFQELAQEMYGTPDGDSFVQLLFKDGMRRKFRKEIPLRRKKIANSVIRHLGPAAPRIVPLEPKKMVRHAQKCSKLGSPPGVVVEGGNRHPFTISRPNKGKVDIDTVKWDRAVERIVKQMAELMDMPNDVYIAQVRAV